MESTPTRSSAEAKPNILAVVSLAKHHEAGLPADDLHGGLRVFEEALVDGLAVS